MIKKHTPLTFQIFEDDELVREESLDQAIIKIGTLSSANLRLDDDRVSRMHAVIEVTESNEICVIDLGSLTGTIVNGEKVNKCLIQDDDELRFGGIRIVVGVGSA